LVFIAVYSTIVANLETMVCLWYCSAVIGRDVYILNNKIMKESQMPVADAHGSTEAEFVSYELAYHVLPTVAEGEVAEVTTALKQFITNHGGEVFDEEAAERFELAYEIEKYLEGRHRRFSSAYFGWVRFRLEPAQLKAVTDEVDTHKSILRTLVVRLTRVEEANPFRFHEALVDTKVRTIDLDEADEEGAEIVEEGEEVEAVVDEVSADATPEKGV
jgi:ribosomal protein S6